MRNLLVRCFALPFVALAVVASLVCVAPLSADPPLGRLNVVVKVSDNVIAGMPARASAVTPEGVLVDYSEEMLDRAPNTQTFILDRLPAGILDIRVEGEGMVTEVKKGVPVFAGQEEKVSILVRPGQGVHIVELAVAGLSREEVAARLASLEAETARLRADIEAMRSKP